MQMETLTQAPATATAPPVNREPRWPWPLAILTAPWLPAMTARRTKTMSLVSAWIAHVVATVSTLFLVSFLCWLDWAQSPFQLLGEMLAELCRSIEDAVVLGGGTVLGIELGLLALALLVTPWGARDERLRDSFRNAFRQTCLHCGHALPAVLLIGVLIIIYGAEERRWNSFSPLQFNMSFPKSPSPTTAPFGSPAYQRWQDAMEKYNADVQAYQVAWREAYRKHIDSQPPIVRHGPPVITHISILATFWVLWSLLRAVGADRGVPTIERPPMCERCGYNLTLAPADGRCSECGRAVIESLRADLRPGTCWERRGTIGRVRAYAATVLRTFAGPHVPGEQISVTSFRRDSALLLCLHMLIAYLLLWISIAGGFYTFVAGRGFDRPEELMLVIAPVFSCMGVLIGLGWGCLCAVAVAVWYRVKLGRNLASAAMWMACHHSAWLIPWAALAGAAVFGLMAVTESGPLMRWSRRLHIDFVALIILPFLGLNVLVALWYLRLIWRGTSAARYANR